MHKRGQIFKIYLMDDSSSRGHNSEIVKSFLCPAQDGITFRVALKLLFLIFLKGISRTIRINLDGMVNDKISRNYRVYF